MSISQSTGRGGFGLFDQPYLLFVLTMLFWAGNILISRATAGDIPPVALAQMRWTLAFLVLLPFALKHIKADWAAIRKGWLTLTVLGFAGITIYNTFLYIGVQTTSAVNASMLSSLSPITIAATGFVIFRDRLTAPQMLAIGVSCVGAAIILSGGDITIFRQMRFVVGDVWIIGSQIAYAFYTVLLRKRPNVHPLTFVTVTIFIGQLILVPFTMAELGGEAAVRLDFLTVGTVLYVVIFPAILAYLFYNRAVELVGSNRAAPFFHLVPAFTSIGAVAFLGEAVEVHHLVGWSLILAGIVATQVFAKRPDAPKHP